MSRPPVPPVRRRTALRTGLRDRLLAFLLMAALVAVSSLLGGPSVPEGADR